MERPTQKLPSPLRRMAPCASSASNSLWAVARGSFVAETTSASVIGRWTTAFSTVNALSRTPTPDTLSISWEVYPT